MFYLKLLVVILFIRISCFEGFTFINTAVNVLGHCGHLTGRKPMVCRNYFRWPQETCCFQSIFWPFRYVENELLLGSRDLVWVISGAEVLENNIIWPTALLTVKLTGILFQSVCQHEMLILVFHDAQLIAIVSTFLSGISRGTRNTKCRVDFFTFLLRLFL